jgi:transposase
MFHELVEWRKKHIHLWTWAVNLRDQLTRRRLEHYRRFAADLVERYGTVYLERFDLRRVSRKAAPEVEDIPITGKYRAIAAPGILRMVIENACRRTGVAVRRIRPRHSTRTCSACGRLEQWNVAKELVHTCRCGATWDQDYNAAIQILRAGQTEAMSAIREDMVVQKETEPMLSPLMG